MPDRPPLSSFEDAGMGLQKLPVRPPLSAFDVTTSGKVPSAEPMTATESVVRGMGQPIAGLEQLQAHMTGPQQAQRADEAIKQRNIEFEQRGGSPLLSGIGSSVAMAPLAATGVGGIPGAIAGGAIGAGIMPTDVSSKPQMFEPTGSSYLDQKIKEMTLGGLFSGGTAGLFKGAGSALAPTLSKEASILQKSGVDLTPGQIYGFKGFEEVASKFPIFGNFIRGAYGNQADSFRRAIGDQVLEPIGKTLNPKAVGRDRVLDVGSKIDDTYKAILPKITATPDEIFNDKLATIKDFAGELPASVRDQFTKIIDNRLGPIFKSYGEGPNGEIYKQADSALRHLADTNLKSNDMHQQEMGRLLYDVRGAMRDLAARQNPEVAPQIKAVDKSYAMYMRMVDASIRRAASGGEFTAADFIQAVAGSKSSRRGAFKTGEALMQTYAEAANKLMPGKIGKQLGMVELGAGVLGANELLTHPAATLAGGAGAAVAGTPYTRPGMAILNEASKNPTLRAMGFGLRKGAPYAGIATGPVEREYTYGGPQE